VACGRITFSPSKRGSSVSTSAVERRVLLARDALAGVEHRIEGLARVVGKARAPAVRLQPVVQQESRVETCGSDKLKYAKEEVKGWMEVPFASLGFLSRPSHRQRSRFRELRTPRRPHAAADAHGDDDALGAAALAFDERVAGQALAGDAVGVAHRDGAAVDVQAVARDAQLVAAIDHLHRERFVQLPQVDVADLQAQLLQHLGIANTGPMPISSGSQPATAKPRKRPIGFRLFARRVLLADHHAGAGAVGELAGVAGRDDAARQRRLDAADAFLGGAGAGPRPC
jgi:hypothetical protein